MVTSTSVAGQRAAGEDGEAAQQGAPAQTLFQLRNVCVKLFAETQWNLQRRRQGRHIKHIAAWRLWISLHKRTRALLTSAFSG